MIHWRVFYFLSDREGNQQTPHALMKSRLTIQERLKDLRKEKDINLEKLEELTGISKSALGSYEANDYKEISHGNLVTLADFYGVSVDYLLSPICPARSVSEYKSPSAWRC